VIVIDIARVRSTALRELVPLLVVSCLKKPDKSDILYLSD